ncbi:MAG TPA: glycine cleavage T C-terminal barrel domain-containing protein [Polyangiaceae bacterium]|nr:glycine cleavage T C-terminal barrel domain-containing protein [Polyangiaceae bacterium]
MSTDQAARSGALLAPSSTLGTLSVTGPDRLTWLQGVVTCDVETLSPGDGRWGLLLTRQGKILADVLIVADVAAVRLGLVGSALARAHDYLSTFLIMEDAELVDDTAALAWVTLHGPQAVDIAGRVVASVGGARASIDVTGLGGAALVVPRAQEATMREAAIREGATAATPEDFERLRVERLVPLYGVDMDEQRSPHEVSLERRTVSWSKGCYLGQEAVCMQDMRGKVKRRLAVVRLEGEEVPPSGAKVFDSAGALVGETRSAARSTLLGGPAALAFLSAAVAIPGTALRVEGASAEVVEPR